MRYTSEVVHKMLYLGDIFIDGRFYFYGESSSEEGSGQKGSS